MNSLINTKELCKQLRVDGKHGMVIWTREANEHFISNRHYAVRFHELPRDVMITLFSIFCRLAEVGETLHSHSGRVIDVQKPVDFSKVYCPEKASVTGSKTPYTRDMGRKLFTAVIKFSSHVSYVDEKYIKLANETETIKTTDSPHAPLYLANDDLMVLPYRTTNPSDFIISLIESEQPV